VGAERPAQPEASARPRLRGLEILALCEGGERLMAEGSRGVVVKEGGESGVRARMVELGPLFGSMPAAESSTRYTSSGSRAARSTCISMRVHFLSVGGVEMYCAAEGFGEEGGPLVAEDGAVGGASGGRPVLMVLPHRPDAEGGRTWGT
jgi:hypothetical protein